MLFVPAGKLRIVGEIVKQKSGRSHDEGALPRPVRIQPVRSLVFAQAGRFDGTNEIAPESHRVHRLKTECADRQYHHSNTHPSGNAIQNRSTGEYKGDRQHQVHLRLITARLRNQGRVAVEPGEYDSRGHISHQQKKRQVPRRVEKPQRQPEQQKAGADYKQHEPGVKRVPVVAADRRRIGANRP